MGWSIKSWEIVVPFLTKKENLLQRQQEKRANTHIMVQMAFRIMFQIIFSMAHSSLSEKMEA